MAGEGQLARLRLARGCRCFAAWVAGEVAAYGWLSSEAEWIGEIGLEIRPEAGEAYIWNCLTLPQHRRQGMFRALLVRISSVLKAEGLRRLWIASDVAEGTDKAVSDAGFAPVLRLKEARLGPAGLRLLRAAAIPGAEPALVAAARRAVSAGGRPLGSVSVARRPATRRH